MTDNYPHRSIRSRGLIIALGALLAMLLPSLTLVGPVAHADPGLETIQASLTGDDVEGFDWPTSSTVDVEIIDADGPGSIFVPGIPTDGGGYFYVDRGTLGDVDLTPGDEVIVSSPSGAPTNFESMILSGPLSISVVAGTAHAVGQGPPGAVIEVEAGGSACGSPGPLPGSVDPSGSWTVDFSGVCPIPPGFGDDPGGRVRLVEPNGNATVADSFGSVVIQASTAHPFADFVQGSGWLPNMPIVIEVNPGSGPVIPWGTNENGDFRFDQFFEFGIVFDLVELDVVRVSQNPDGFPATGDEIVKETVLQDLTFDVLAQDPANLAVGSSDQGDGWPINVGVGNEFGGSNLTVPVSGNMWSADFNTAIPPFVIDENTGGQALSPEAVAPDGDSTAAETFGPPRFEASVSSPFDDFVQGDGWVPDMPILIEVNPGAGPVVPWGTGPGGNFRVNPTFEAGTFFDLQPLDVVRVTQFAGDTGAAADIVKETVLADLTFDELNRDPVNTAAGGSDQEGRDVTVDLGNQFGGASLDATVTGGDWLADFNTVPFVIDDETGGQARIAEVASGDAFAPSDSTVAEPIQLPSFQVSTASAFDDLVQGEGWFPNTPILIEVDPGVGPVIAWGTDEGGNFRVNPLREVPGQIPPDSFFDIFPNTVVRVTQDPDGDPGTPNDIVKETIAQALTFDELDPVENTAGGTSDQPGAPIAVGIGNEFGGANIIGTVNPGGDWLVDFDDVGYDFDNDVGGQARVDEPVATDALPPGDGTVAEPIGAPVIAASITDNWIRGNGLPPNLPVDIGVNGFFPGTTGDIFTDDGGNFWADPGYLDGAFGGGFDLDFGDVVDVVVLPPTGTAGFLKSVTLIDLAVDDVDFGADLVTGSSDQVPPESIEVAVDEALLDAPVAPGPVPPSGFWAADFTTIGVDVVPANNIEARHLDAEGDATVAQPELTRISVSPTGQWINGERFRPDAQLEIDINGAVYGWGTDPGGGFFVETGDIGADPINPGDVVTVTDFDDDDPPNPLTTRVLVVDDLSFDGLRADLDIAFGNTGPIPPAGPTFVSVNAGNDFNGFGALLATAPDGSWFVDIGNDHGQDVQQDWNGQAQTYDDDGDSTVVDKSAEPFDLEVVKSGPADAVAGAGDVVHEVTITNLGPAFASGIELFDLVTSLPVGVSITDVDPGPDAAWDPGADRWNVFGLEPGASATLTITYDVPADAVPGLLTNEVGFVGANEEELGEGAPNGAAVTTTIEREVDLALTKTDSIDPVVAGSGPGNLVHTVTLTNHGPSDASNITVEDVLTLPTGVSVDSVTASAGLWTDPNWTLPSLAAESSETLTVELTADETTAEGVDTIVDTATVIGVDEPDTDPANDSVIEATSVRRAVDIAVGKSPVDASAVNGQDQLTFTVTATNNGPSDASGVKLLESMTLPPGVTVASIVPSGATVWNPPFWEVGDLPLGATESLTVTLDVDAAAEAGDDVVMNTASLVFANEVDTDSSNNSATVTADLAREVDIGVLTSESIDPVVAGSGPGNLVHTVTVTNNGPSDATGVEIGAVVGLPAGVTVDSRVATTGAVVGDVWTLDLADGDSANLLVTYTAGSDAPDGAPIEVTATLDAVNEPDGDIGNNVSVAKTDVDREVDIVVTKAGSADPVVAGSGVGNLVYTVTVTNDGPSDATDVTVDDVVTLPAGVAVDSVVASSGAFVDPTWTLPTLAAGTSETLAVTLTVGAAAADGATITNDASLIGVDENETDSTNDATSVETTIERSVDIAITNTVDEAAPVAGEGDVTFTVTATNDGPSDASGVDVADIFVPVPGAVLSSITPSAGAYSGSTWTIGDLASGASETLEIVVDVDEVVTDGAVMTNIAVLKTVNEADSDALDNFGLATSTVSVVGTVEDIEGYTALTPFRLLDSRPVPLNVGPFSSPWGAGTSRSVTVTGGAVPADATAVVMNITTVGPTAQSFLTISPTGVARPTAAALNFAAGVVRNDVVIAAVGDGGQVDIYNEAGSVNLVIDVVGYYAPGTGDGYNAGTPFRLLDSRPVPLNVGPFSSPWGAGTSRSVTVTGGAVPADATAVVMNITTVGPTAQSFLTISPTGVARPTAAALNFAAGVVRNDVVIAAVGDGGQVDIYNEAGSVNLVIDVVGYYAPGTGDGYNAGTPFRLLDSRPVPLNVGPFSSPWGAGTSRSVTVTGGAVPADATAVVMNITTVGPTAQSFLTISPTGVARPTAAALNFAAGVVRNDVVIAAVGDGGQVDIYNEAGSVNLVIDVVGYYAPDSG